MSESKTIRLSGDLHKMLKLAAVEAGLSMQEFLKRVLTSHGSKGGNNDGIPDCPLCRKYGAEPNEETRKALDDEEGETFSGVGDYFKDLEKRGIKEATPKK